MIWGSSLYTKPEAVWVRLIGVWARGAKEAWWLATNLTNAISKVVSYYDRRMGIEEQFRRHERRALWHEAEVDAIYPCRVRRADVFVGRRCFIALDERWRAVEKAELKVRLESKTKGLRLSLARIGLYCWQRVTKQLRLTTRFVKDHLPPPQLRMFKWLMAPQK